MNGLEHFQVGHLGCLLLLLLLPQFFVQTQIVLQLRVLFQLPFIDAFLIELIFVHIFDGGLQRSSNKGIRLLSRSTCLPTDPYPTVHLHFPLIPFC